MFGSFKEQGKGREGNGREVLNLFANFSKEKEGECRERCLPCLQVWGKGKELVHFINTSFYKSSLPLLYHQFRGE